MRGRAPATSLAVAAGHEIWLTFAGEWAPSPDEPGRRGLLASHERVRTLLRVLVSYPEVRFVLPDRIGLDAAADPRTVETIERFLGRQGWLIRSVAVR
ncbi:MAG: hypothetical protein L0027_06760 [Candidatus Rokubacteria bacterium]|nr:hypothetical protein [Candidatus Rokubacteria bacterium]